ncbi:MAG TPA: peptidylprolyl isomerase [Anaerolinea sp.]|nr:peptidylprolyl isomerase [Anaerolinea sp.]
MRLALLLVLLLSACAGAAPSAPSATPTQPLNLATPLPTTFDCVVVASAETPEATETSLFPPPTAADWSFGPADASVTFLEYTDFTAQATPALDLNLARLAQAFPNQVRRVFRPFPLPTNDKSLLAAAAAEAAGQQDRFWEMSALLVEQQADWLSLSPDDFRAYLLQQAAALGLDAARFAAALDDPVIQAKLAAAQQFGLQAAIPVMPWLLINGSIYQGPRDYRSLENLVGLLTLEKKQYFARLQTAKGEISIQLLPEQAPLAVNNFVFLARQGWYDGVTFHRVIPGYIAQSGDPSGSGFGTPGYAFPDDLNNLRFDQPGLLAMASPGPDSNGSQFFITYQANAELNGRYVIFGKVIQGLDVLSRLTPRDPSSSADLPPGDVIQTVTIEER